MKIKWKCIKFVTNLTVDAVYEQRHYPGNVMNILLTNDEGLPQYVDKRNLELVEDEVMANKDINAAVSKEMSHYVNARCADWCGDPAAWGWLVRDHHIDVSYRHESGDWFAGTGNTNYGLYDHEVVDKDIGVAVCKCYLLKRGVSVK